MGYTPPFQTRDFGLVSPAETTAVYRNQAAVTSAGATATMPTSRSSKGSHPSSRFVTSFPKLQSSLPWEILFISPCLHSTDQNISKVHVMLTSTISTQHAMRCNHLRPHINNGTHLICHYCLIDRCEESTSMPAKNKELLSCFHLTTIIKQERRIPYKFFPIFSHF